MSEVIEMIFVFMFGLLELAFLCACVAVLLGGGEE